MMGSELETLPTLGVGASLSFGMEPDPVALVDLEGGPSFIEYAGAVQSELYSAAIAQLHAKDTPVLYHPSCMNLCGPWPNHPQWLQAIAEHVDAVKSPWLAQDVAVCYAGERPGYSIQLGYFISPILTEASLDEAVQRVLEVRRVVKRPLLLEPPPATFRLGEMSIFDWLGQLAERTDCGLLLDAGHVLSHQLVEGGQGLKALPLERVIELHVAGGILKQRGERWYYIDAHDVPVQPETWKVFDHLLANCPQLKAVCLECEGSAAAMVLPALEKVRQRVRLKAASDDLRSFVRSQSPARSTTLPDLEPTSSSVPDVAAPPVQDTGYEGLLRLLLDAELRERLASEDSSLAGELGIESAGLEGIDRVGLALDAEARRSYLMSALCRSHPIGAGILGAMEGGADRLAAFLTSPTLRGLLSERSQAFCVHLRRVLARASLSSEEALFGGTFIDFESALVTTATQLRQAIHGGAPPPQVQKTPSRAQRRSGSLVLPSYTLLVELPTSPQAMRVALGHISPQTAWAQIESGALDFDRARALMRADHTPVTVISRAVVTGMAGERAGAGGVSPILDVSWRTIELRGRQSRKIAALAGEKLSALTARSKRTAETLLSAGVIELS
jgi:uncharacterized protein (UPF0276 family)